jgi:prepilin-type N-terminal cleavage/methylation domain-containing protein
MERQPRVEGREPEGALRRASQRRASQDGFTLVELIVAILIIVVVVGGLSLGLGGLRRTDLTTVAGRIDGVIRYLYQVSSINATPYRLVIDIDGGGWWVEALEQESSACRSFAVKDVRRKDLPRLDKKSKRKGRFGSRSADRDTAEKDEMKRCPEEERDADGEGPKRGFAKEPSKLLRARSLPKDVAFTGIMTTHQQDIQKEGKGYVYFFPNGTAEKAYIYVSSVKGEEIAETFTIETYALLGKVKVHHEKLDLRGVLRED